MQAAGAVIIEDINIEAGDLYDAEYEVLLVRIPRRPQCLPDSRRTPPLSSLADLIAYNEANTLRSVMPIFGQEIFHAAEAKGPLTEAAYLAGPRNQQADLPVSHPGPGRRAQPGCACIAPTNGPAWLIDPINGDSFGIGSSSLAAISGYPSVTVPAGFVAGLPIGLSFIALPWNEKQLIEIAYAFEQTTGFASHPTCNSCSKRYAFRSCCSSCCSSA